MNSDSEPRSSFSLGTTTWNTVFTDDIGVVMSHRMGALDGIVETLLPG